MIAWGWRKRRQRLGIDELCTFASMEACELAGLDYASFALAFVDLNIEGTKWPIDKTIAQGGAANRLRLTIQVYDAQLGKHVGAADLSGSRQELFELVTRTGNTLRNQLGIGGISSAQAAALRASRPTTTEMAELYAQGLDKLRHFDAVNARKLLERVVTSDPDYPLGHLALADVFTALGYDERAKAETALERIMTQVRQEALRRGNKIEAIRHGAPPRAGLTYSAAGTRPV